MEAISSELTLDRMEGDEEAGNEDVAPEAPAEDKQWLEEEHDIAIRGLYGNMDHMGG